MSHSYSSYDSYDEDYTGSSQSYSGEDSYVSGESSSEDPQLTLYRNLTSLEKRSTSGDGHHKHHHSGVVKTAVKGAKKVAPLLILEPKQSETGLVKLPELQDLECHKTRKVSDYDDEQEDVEREYMENGLSATDLTCAKCGGRMKKKQMQQQLDAKWYARRQDTREPMPSLELQCEKCGHCRLHHHQKKTSTPMMSTLALDKIVLPETQPIDTSLFHKAKKVVKRFSPRRHSRSSSSNGQQQPPNTPPVNNPPSGDQSMTGSASSGENGAMGLDYPYGHRRHGRPYYYDYDPYYYDPYYRRPHIWPFFEGKPVEGQEKAPNTNLDWHLFPHRHHHHHHDDRPHHHHHHYGDQKPSLSEAKKFVEANFAATPIQRPVNTNALALGKPLSQHTVQEYEALLGETDAISASKLSIQKLGAQLTQLEQSVMPLDARRKHKRHFYRGPRKGEWCVREPMPQLELNSPSASSVPTLPLAQNSQLQRLATQLSYADKIEQPSLRAMLLGEPMINLAKRHKSSSDEDVHKPDMFAHLAHRHALMYNLLRDNGLLELLRQTADLILMVPHDDSLATVTNRVSDETEALLRYHALIVPVAQPIKEIDGMTEYATLDGENRVQVENRGQCYFVNGHKMQSDIYFPSQMFIVRGLLSPAQLVTSSGDAPPTDLPPPMDQTTEEPTNQSSSTTDAGDSESSEESVGDGSTTTTTEEPGGDTVTTTEHMFVAVPSTAMALKGFHKTSQAQNQVVSTIATQMNRGAYMPALDMKSYLDSTYTPIDKAQLTLRTYNPEPLFRQYESRTLPDIARLQAECEKPQCITVDTKHQRRLDIGNRQSLSEYSLDSTSGRETVVKKADLLSGITELSFPSPQEPGKVCVLRCRIHGSENDLNTYVSEDESVLLRFKGNVLDTVAVNTQATCMPVASVPHQGPQYLELFFDFETDEKRDAFYNKRLSRDEFSQMLLLDAKLMRVLKKKARQAKKKATHVGRKLLNRGQREKKRLGAIRVQAIALNQLPLSELADFEASGVTPVNVPLTVTVYNKAVEVVQEDSLEQVQAQKFRYKVGSEQLTGYVLQGENGLALNLGSGKRGQYIDVRTNLETASFNFTNITLSTATQAYYGVSGNNLYMLQFDANGMLKRMLIMPKKTRVIRGLAL